MSRDPIGERGGPGLWAFLRNRIAGYIDPLGLEDRRCCLKEPLKLCWQSMDLRGGNVIIDQTVRFEHDPSPPKCCDSSCCEYKQVVRGRYRRLSRGAWRNDPHELNPGEWLRPDEFRDDGYNRDEDASWYHPSDDGTEEYYNGSDEPGVNDGSGSPFGNLDARLEFVAFVSDTCRKMGLVGAVSYSVRVEPYSYPPSFSGPPRRYKVSVKGIPKCSGPPKWK